MATPRTPRTPATPASPGTTSARAKLYANRVKEGKSLPPSAQRNPELVAWAKSQLPPPKPKPATKPSPKSASSPPMENAVSVDRPAFTPSEGHVDDRRGMGFGSKLVETGPAPNGEYRLNTVSEVLKALNDHNGAKSGIITGGEFKRTTGGRLLYYPMNWKTTGVFAQYDPADFGQRGEATWSWLRPTSTPTQRYLPTAQNGIEVF